MSYVAEVLADSPRLYLRLGESAGPTAADSSGLGHDGTYVGCTFSQPGAVADGDTAVLLDGVDDSVTVTDHADLDLGDVFTLECWVKRVASGVNQFLFAKGTNAYGLHINSSDGLSLIRNGVVVLATSSVALGTTSFQHVAATKNGAAINVYVDAVDATVAGTNSVCTDTATDLTIGSQAGGGGWLNATVDEAALYATALSADRVLSHFNASAAPLEQTAIWPYNRQGPF